MMPEENGGDRKFGSMPNRRLPPAPREITEPSEMELKIIDEAARKMYDSLARAPDVLNETLRKTTRANLSPNFKKLSIGGLVRWLRDMPKTPEGGAPKNALIFYLAAEAYLRRRGLLDAKEDD